MATPRSTTGTLALKKRNPPPGSDPAPEMAPSSSPTTAMVEEAKRKMIAEAAYYRAEKRGFAPGCEIDDWLAAEAEITASTSERSAPSELH
jgi:hypothetical protein